MYRHGQYDENFPPKLMQVVWERIKMIVVDQRRIKKPPPNKIKKHKINRVCAIHVARLLENVLLDSKTNKKEKK